MLRYSPLTVFFSALWLVLVSSSCTMRQPTFYRAARWSELPVINDQEWIEGFKAWKGSCPIIGSQPAWQGICSDAQLLPEDAPAIRQFLTGHFQLFAVRDSKKKESGLITGYYEPVYPGSLERTEQAMVPVYGVPDDLITVNLDPLFPALAGKRVRGRLKGKTLVPYFTANEIAQRRPLTTETTEATWPILGWLTDPMDLQFLQIQGSGRIRLASGEELRLGYADQNGHLYRAIGRWLVQQGELLPEAVTMQSIRAWASVNPDRIQALLGSNPSYVFFQLLPPADEGPLGSLQVPLTAGYSIAADKQYIPLGSLAILSTTTPDEKPLRRLTAVQDTGGAIRGPIRADLFFGKGDAAGEIAGRMKQQGQLWLLWPLGFPLPVNQ